MSPSVHGALPTREHVACAPLTRATMPLFSEHIANMYYGGSSSYSAPYSYKSSVLPLGGSYSASYLSPGSSYSNHSSLGGYSRAPVTSRWTPSSARNYSPILSTISERSTSSPSRITSPRRIPLLKRSYNSSSYISRPININTADIDVSRNKYTPKASEENQDPPQSESCANAENGPFMPRIDGKPETGIDSSPGEHQRSTIKRGRTVVRLHTIKRKERDSPKKGDPEQQVTEAAGGILSENNVIESEETLGWRERLSDDLVYKDKREKKTLGAKLVEKFIVKDSNDDTETVAKRSPKPETVRNTSGSLTTSLPKRVSPDRRYSMELLEEQANLLDSMIRNENLSTAPLDLSKVGISESTDILGVTGSTKRRKASNDKNPLQTTKSDHSLYDRINSLKEQKNTNFSKRRSLKKSLSGGSIRRLASITEFPKEATQNNSLPAIEENRLSIKEEKTKKDLKVKTKRKPKITSTVEITQSVSSPKFKVENITVEEKSVSPKKEFSYSSTIHDNFERDDYISSQSDNNSRKSKVRYSSKRKTKKRDSDEGSPEPDDGNFWGKIGKRETVYLMKRKQIIEDAKEQHRRAMFWFEGDDESLQSTSDPCDNNNKNDSVSLCDTDSIKTENILSQQEQNPNVNNASLNTTSMTITSVNPDYVISDNTKDKQQNHTVAPLVDDVRFTRNSIKNSYLSKNSVTAENKILEAKLAKIENESIVSNNTDTTLTEKPQLEREETVKLSRDNNEIKIQDNSYQLSQSKSIQVESDLTIGTESIETIEPQEHEKVINENEKQINALLPPVDGKNIENIEITELPGTSKSDTTYTSKQQIIKDIVKENKECPVKNAESLKEPIVKYNSEIQKISKKEEKTVRKEKSISLQNCLCKSQKNESHKDKTIEEKQKQTVLQQETVIQLKNSSSIKEPNTTMLKSEIHDMTEEITQIEPIRTSITTNQIENIPITGNDVTSILTPEELKVGYDKKADNILEKDEQESSNQLSPKTPVKLVTSPRKPVKIEAAIRPLIATPRPLQKKVPQVVQSSSSDETSSEEDSSEEDADDSDTSAGSTEFFECETNTDGRTSTGSNDSGFDSSAPASPAGFINVKKDCDVNCHRKCEKLTANLCGVNQRLLVEALASQSASKRGADSPGPSTASAPAATAEMLEQELEQSTAYSLFRKTGRFTPPAKSIPRFRKYNIDDFQFIKVLGKGSFGKVLLAELRDTEYYYAVKCLKKDVVLEDDDVECTLIERKVLALGTNHPYLCHLFATFQTDSHLFFVMEYLNGGDLMFHIQQSGRFPEARARFYAAEIVSGLKFLHKRGIVYRDLKLDNILLDYEGHVRIADFGMCKLQIYLEKTADTFCGTPDYMAPEIIKGLKYNQTVDWWSFGVLLYEMLIGQSPFSGCDEDELFWSICNEMPSYPRFLSQEALTILTRLLDKDSRTRMGGTDCMHGDIRDQDFFRPVHWDRLERRELETPFKPRVRHPLDTQYFDRAFTGERPRLTTVEPNVLRSMDQGPFRGFSYTNPNATDR